MATEVKNPDPSFAGGNVFGAVLKNPALPQAPDDNGDPQRDQPTSSNATLLMLQQIGLLGGQPRQGTNAPPQSNLPPGPSPMGGAYCTLKAPGMLNTDRRAPAWVDAKVKPGTIACFDGDHIQMCVGFDKDGHSKWISDTEQGPDGTHFFCNAECARKGFALYDPPANFDTAEAIKILKANAAGDYTGNCAKFVRVGTEAGLHHELGPHPVHAADYNRTDTLEKAGFTRVNMEPPATLAVASASPTKSATQPAFRS